MDPTGRTVVGFLFFVFALFFPECPVFFGAGNIILVFYGLQGENMKNHPYSENGRTRKVSGAIHTNQAIYLWVCF